MLKAVIFDIDNTLYDYDAAHAPAFQALTAFACETFSLTPQRFAELHRSAERELEIRCGGNCAAVHNRLLRYQALLERLGQPIAYAPGMSKLYWSTLLEAMRPYPDAVETMARLKAMGLTIGIGTNMTAENQYEKLARIGAMPYVDFMVTSEEVTAEKPDRRLFDACAKKAGCAPEACAFVGDSVSKDVRGAMNAGMRAIWFCREGEPDRAIPGATTIRALSELPELLAECRNTFDTKEEPCP
ncbi:MAG: HAD family hydrolase [Clostridia bacterium]|nr:HAD family hydrolase [Clostridia bacterium]